MENKSVVISAFFLALGAIFMALAFRYWQQANHMYSVLKPELVIVLTAARDLPAGTILNKECLEEGRIPWLFRERESYEIRSSEDWRAVDKLVTAIRIPKGNQLIRSSLRIPVALPAAAAKPIDINDTTPSQKHYLEGVKYFQNSDYMKARKEWKQAIKLDPSNNDAAAGLYRISQILND